MGGRRPVGETEIISDINHHSPELLSASIHKATIHISVWLSHSCCVLQRGHYIHTPHIHIACRNVPAVLWPR